MHIEAKIEKTGSEGSGKLRQVSGEVRLWGFGALSPQRRTAAVLKTSRSGLAGM